MRTRLYSLALVVVLGGGFALAQSMPQPSRQNQSGMQPSQAQTSDQSAGLKTQADIQTALAKDAGSASSNVNVLVTSTTVELTGTVASESDKNKVEQVATAHSGGLPVRNNIKVVASSPK